MPNPFDPPKPLVPSSLTPPPPPNHPPEFLPASAFNEWPTWSSIETSLRDLIANSKPNHINSTNHFNTTNAPTHHRNTSNINAIQTTTPRKRRPSKPADSAQLRQDDPALLLEGEKFGINEVVEALRGKVEVERVMGRLRVERRVLWGVGSGQLLGGDEGGGDAVAEGR